MTVAELIVFLQKQNPELPIVYRCCSEWDTLTTDMITVDELCLPRPDGWVAEQRPDKRSQTYLTFPGN